jgi:hypothetical protein
MFGPKNNELVDKLAAQSYFEICDIKSIYF